MVYEPAVDAVRRHQAQRGQRAVRPVRVRRPRRRGADAVDVRRPRARRGVGQVRPARLRARDARPLRLRPSAARGRAHPRGRGRHLDRHAAVRAARGRHGDRGRHPVVGHPPGDQGRAPWARATLEDLEGSIEVLFFPATYAQVGLQVVEDALVVLKGRPQARDDSVELIVSDLTLPDLTDGRRARSSSTWRPPAAPSRWSNGCARSSPPTPAPPRSTCSWSTASAQQKLRLGDGYRVTPSAALMADLKALLGPARSAPESRPMTVAWVGRVPRVPLMAMEVLPPDRVRFGAGRDALTVGESARSAGDGFAVGARPLPARSGARGSGQPGVAGGRWLVRRVAVAAIRWPDRAGGADRAGRGRGAGRPGDPRRDPAPADRPGAGRDRSAAARLVAETRKDVARELRRLGCPAAR